MAEDEDLQIDLDTEKIKEWRSIVTLIVFVIANIIVLFPFHITFWLPRKFTNGFRNLFIKLRVVPPREEEIEGDDVRSSRRTQSPWARLEFPVNFVTGPLIADLFLLAIRAIGSEEVKQGTLGGNHIEPIDIMAFFITLAYIAISIDASGLIRYAAFKVLQWGGDVGHRLFFYLYAFFFAIATVIGNDPIILSGTAFLAYMTRVSSNIIHPRAWIYSQFAVANIASAILVSSNPTNLVLAGAFKVRFIDYTANMIVPVIFTGIILFPFLLYIVFGNESLIPVAITMHELPESRRGKPPVNPNIPHARGKEEEEELDLQNDEQGKLLSLDEIMNPFLDKGGAAFGAVVMLATLVTVLALNAASTQDGPRPVYWVTVPGAFIMLCWDLGFGWYHREETRKIAQKGREEVEYSRVERAIREEDEAHEMKRPRTAETKAADGTVVPSPPLKANTGLTDSSATDRASSGGLSTQDEKRDAAEPGVDAIAPPPVDADADADEATVGPPAMETEEEHVAREEEFRRRVAAELERRRARRKPTLVSASRDAYRWCQETFPTVTAVVNHLPFALVPFAFSMFVLVQGLVTKGWTQVFAYGWDHWVTKTDTVGAIGGMGFLSVILCNFAGTNIGTTILLSRVIQAWMKINADRGSDISDRNFWATVYSMALGVNYGAFSTAFSASLAGLLWRDILSRKHIRVRGLDFARVNLPIIAIAMTVGCAVLTAEIYIHRKTTPYSLE